MNRLLLAALLFVFSSPVMAQYYSGPAINNQLRSIFGNLQRPNTDINFLYDMS